MDKNSKNCQKTDKKSWRSCQEITLMLRICFLTYRFLKLHKCSWFDHLCDKRLEEVHWNINGVIHFLKFDQVFTTLSAPNTNFFNIHCKNHKIGLNPWLPHCVLVIFLNTSLSKRSKAWKLLKLKKLIG